MTKASVRVRPKIFLADEHEIDPDKVDKDAIQVIEQLKQAGYKAYLVGGSVRDLLAGQEPKDFDISTSAEPEQIKHLFKRKCLLIGRRFRLAHLRFGHKIFEVSTFRAGDNEIDETELIIRDNTWGTEEEDVLRRDFTINGLYFDPIEHKVIDYVGGWEDIHKRILRTIGNPEMRFRQDPVRMIRLLKFRARFGFDIESHTKKALLACKEEILKSGPARILEEMMRMLESGYAGRFFHLMHQSGLLKYVFPTLSDAFDTPINDEIFRYLSVADELHRHHRTRPLRRSVLLATLLYPVLQEKLTKKIKESGTSLSVGELLLLTGDVVEHFVSSSFSRLPKKLSIDISYVLSTQFKITPLTGKIHNRQKLFKNKCFQAALRFLQVRSIVNSDLHPTYQDVRKSYHHFLQEGVHQTRHHPAP